VDAIAGLLDGPRARDAFVLRASLDPPWSLRVRDEAPIAIIAMARGASWVAPDGEEPCRVGPGDVAILRGPDHYTVADEPDRPPQVVIQPGEMCTTPDGRDLREQMTLGVRTWGNSPAGATVMLVGTYAMEGEVSGRLLRVLPALIVLRDCDWDSPLVPLLADEVVKDDPGQGAVLDRLLDLLLIAVLRAWFARPDAAAPAWYRASSDPVVGHAMRLLHDDPGRPWTVASLADAVGMSRSGLARRFGELVGVAPMTYLADWRISLAADMLREPGQTIGSVAERVGYGSAFALSTAFKRMRGVSPRTYVARASAASASGRAHPHSP
jgi:AraC-like DNA-binding protein